MLRDNTVGEVAGFSILAWEVSWVAMDGRMERGLLRQEGRNPSYLSAVRGM
jgi:hypothetical protein